MAHLMTPVSSTQGCTRPTHTEHVQRLAPSHIRSNSTLRFPFLCLHAQLRAKALRRPQQRGWRRHAPARCSGCWAQALCVCPCCKRTSAALWAPAARPSVTGAVQPGQIRLVPALQEQPRAAGCTAHTCLAGVPCRGVQATDTIQGDISAAVMVACTFRPATLPQVSMGMKQLASTTLRARCACRPPPSLHLPAAISCVCTC